MEQYKKYFLLEYDEDDFADSFKHFKRINKSLSKNNKINLHNDLVILINSFDYNFIKKILKTTFDEGTYKNLIKLMKSIKERIDASNSEL